MKTQEEIEQLVEQIYPQGKTLNVDYISASERSSYIKGYTQCQEDMAKRTYTEAEIQQVLDGFTNEAPGQYIKTNFIDLLKKQK